MNRGRRPQRFPRRQNVQNQGFPRNINNIGLTRDRLQDLLPQEPSEITLSLASNLQAVNIFLNQNKNDDLAELFVRVVKKSMQSNSLKEKNNQILSMLMNSDFSLNISQQILRMTLSNRRHVEFLQNLMFILKTILLQNPSEYLRTLQITGAINVTLLSQFENRDEDVRNLKMMYDELQNLMQTLTEEQRKQKNEKVPRPELPPELPPENFRDLEMMPTVEAIHSEKQIFLRKNKVKGAYENVDHYLDVQFRLMKEDFFGPLRDGIQQYLRLKNEHKGQRIDNLYIYSQVYILYPLCTLNGIAYKVSFDVSNLKINWEQSKRLIYGSLVCLTSDNFQTVHFATVTERKTSDLKDGLVDLSFFSTCEDISRLSSKTVFIMAETMAFFEAYRPVLEALKEITDDNMPFKEYIIHGKSEVAPPKYLSQGRHLKMDLTCITDDCKMVFSPNQKDTELEYQRKNLSLNILNDAWPSAEVLKLNESQHEALQNALTKEFSLTQGPPGTGKTYIGLKIVKALCFNADIWRKNEKSPMLIVCYTNHALDQFLEGIASFLEGGILRVGGRSNSEVLSTCLLSKLRESYRREKYFTREFIKTKTSTQLEKRDLQYQIEEITYQIKRTKEGILHKNLLENQMGQFHNSLVTGFQNLFRDQARSKMSVLTQWLGYGNIEVLEMDADLQDVDHEEGAAEVDDPVLQELPDEENKVNMYTEIDFIQHNRMMENDGSSVEQLFSAMKIEDDKLIALKPDDFDGEGTASSDGFQKSKREKKKLKIRLQRDLDSNILMEDQEFNQIRYRDTWLMNKQKRWKLYRRWVASYCQQLQAQIVQKETAYNDVCKAYKELLNYEDGEIMKNSLIIGMTTTGAARYHALLQEIKPKIIIVEEAAEILEAHVITALNPMCEHLILIGDHKQLRPNPNVYKLARNYNLEISLFERMVLNKCHVKCLSHQHRMRPEISQLLHPIYPELHDHDSVTKYNNIRGLVTNIYFIHHNEPEKTHREGSSYNNPHEASFVIELCKYLLKQGYNQSQITILTTYTAQLFLLRDLMKKESCKGVRLTVVDNYQGEENDIILLSLVRNNSERRVGFLKTDNRVCVALSRAKMGFYVCGNFEMLAVQSELWKRIVMILKSKDQVGYKLTLRCENHPDQKIQVSEKLDFTQAPEGGCLKPCECRLECGHTCKRLCHPVNDHDKYKCLEICIRIAPGCPQNHKCVSPCSKKCPPCRKRVVKIIPKCNHQQLVPCSQDPSEFSCQEACQKLLPCGHQCMEKCNDFCTNQCKVDVSKTYPCKHIVKSPCFMQDDLCLEPCSKTLDCGHKCNSRCGECFDRRVHSLCFNGCTRLLVCGHQCSSKQCDTCSPCLKPCQNRCIHNKCMKLCGELCVPCKEPCAWRCEHYKCRRLCHESCDRPKCEKACSKKLRCGHPCVGLCGEKCPRLCRVCNKNELTEIFFGEEDEVDACFVELENCGHIFEKSGLDSWMSQETDGEIQLKVCPRCKVPIRKNLRYGQVINKILLDINMVKDRLIGDRQQINGLSYQIMTDLEKMSQNDRVCLQMEWSKNKLSTLSYWRSFSYRISFLLALDKLKINLRKDSSVQKHCEDFSQWLLKHREIFSKTELEETEMEMERIGKIIQFRKALKKVMIMSMTDQDKIKPFIEWGLQLLKSGDYSSVKDDVLKIEKHFSKIIPAISENERIQIVKAIGLPPGHWFKCQKGHYYVIGECGGAMVRSNCPECGSTIGGEGHALAEGNTFAGEMDGASYAAWSDQANMANYQFE